MLCCRFKFLDLDAFHIVPVKKMVAECRRNIEVDLEDEDEVDIDAEEGDD